MKISRVVVIFLLLLSDIYPQDIWEHLNLTSQNKVIHILDLKQVKGKNLIGTDSGLYYSNDNYKTIIYEDKFPNNKVVRKIITDSTNTFLLCDTIFESSGKSWNKLPYVGPCTDLIELKDNILIGGFYEELPRGGPPRIAGMFYYPTDSSAWGAGKQFGFWRVFNIACDTQNNIYISTQNMYKDPVEAFSIFISKDNGKTVSNISKGFPSMPINSIYINNITDDVYLCTYKGLFKYLISDSSWILLSLNNKMVKSLVIDKNIMYAVVGDWNYDSVMVSSDQGINWNFYISGFGNIRSYDQFKINVLTIDSSNYIYAGTSNGLYRAKLYNPVGIEEVNSAIPWEFSLEQNYPNPFNPVTTIKYSIPQNQLVTLKIFDLLGREIMSLVNDDKSPGKYSVNFDGSSFASGIYFYRMQAGNFIDTKKFILIK